MKKVLAAFLVLVAIFLAYAAAAMSYPLQDGEKAGLGDRLAAPFKNFQGTTGAALALGAAALIGALFFMFSSRPRAASPAGAPAKTPTRFLKPRKSKGLEMGFLLSGLAALAILVLSVFASIKGWFGEIILGTLGCIFVLQLIMGVPFFLLFLKKKDKMILPFIPAALLFIIEVAAFAFALVMGNR